MIMHRGRQRKIQKGERIGCLGWSTSGPPRMENLEKQNNGKKDTKRRVSGPSYSMRGWKESDGTLRRSSGFTPRAGKDGK
jgi:hypothetical protein